MTGEMTEVGVDPGLVVGMTSETADGTVVLTGVAGLLPSGVHQVTGHTAQFMQQVFCTYARIQC